MSVVLVLLIVEGAGLTGVLAVALVTQHGPPALSRLLPGIGAGLAGLTALGAFYRALAIGTISIVAPVAATGVAVPVLVGLAGGENPAAAQIIGILAAAGGVILASREQGDPTRRQAGANRRALGLALIAAAGFGTFMVGLRSTARADLLWSLIAARACVLPLACLAVTLAARRRIVSRPSRGDLPLLLLSGALDLSANGLYAAATRHGLLSVVAVASSLYPVITVMLARLLLQERVRRVQGAGIIAALTGVVLMAAGG